MTDFDKNVIPKECDVISVWISKFDQARGDKRQLNQDEKDEIIEDIVQSLIFIWQSQNLEIMEARRIKDQVKRLIDRTAHLVRAVHRRKNDEVFQREEFEHFNHVFHIGTKPSSHKKQKNDDLDTSKVGTKKL